MTQRLIAIIAILFTTAAMASAAPVILNASSDVAPGDVICVQGANFGSTPSIWLSINHGTYTQLTTLNSGNGVVEAQLPTGSVSLYTVEVYDGTNYSAGQNLNVANPMHFDTPEVADGDPFRIFGRNLSPAGSGATVALVNGGTTLTGTVTAQTNTCLTVDAPNAVVGTVYTVNVWNGLGSSSTDTISCPITIKGRSATGSDTFSLGVPWGRDYPTTQYNVKTSSLLPVHAAGDGTTNDQPNIQTDINYISTTYGGGCLYFPAGNYKLLCPTAGPPATGNIIMMKNNVVLQGAGQSSTTLTYGYESSVSGAYLANFFQTTLDGICDMTIVDLNNAGVSMGSIYVAAPSQTTKAFLARVTWNFEGSYQASFNGNQMVVNGCTIEQDDNNVLSVSGTNNRIMNSTFTTLEDTALGAGGSQNVVEGNNFVLNANAGVAPPAGTRHGLSINYSSNIAVLNNTWSAINGTAYIRNDAEAILAEGNDQPTTELGNVVSATSTTLTVNQTGSLVTTIPTEVAIVSGTGLGQWRTITYRGVPGTPSATMTVSPAWTVTPDSTSVYTINAWGMKNITITGNNLSGWLCGPILYRVAASDTYIGGNTINGMGIWLTPAEKNTGTTTSFAGSFDPQWNIQVDGNTVSSSGVYGCYIGINPGVGYYSLANNFVVGTMILNDEVRNNTLIGSEIAGNETGNDSTQFYNTSPCEESIYDYLTFVHAPASYSIPASLGTIIQSNTVSGAGNQPANQAFLINGGDYETVLYGNTVYDDSTFLDDSVYWGEGLTPIQGHSTGTFLDSGGLTPPIVTAYPATSGVTVHQGTTGDGFGIQTGYPNSLGVPGSIIGGMGTVGDYVTINNIVGDGEIHQVSIRNSNAHTGWNSDLLENGSLIGSMTWTNTGGWDTFDYNTLSLAFPVGSSNTFTVEKDAANTGGAALDLFSITSNGWTSPSITAFTAGSPNVTVVQGVSGDNFGIKTGYPEATGGEIIGGMGTNGDYVTINNIVGDGAVHKVTFRNSNASSGTTNDIYVNGDIAGTVTWNDTGSYQDFDDQTISLTLPVGTTDTITVKRDSGNTGGAALDKIIIN